MAFMFDISHVYSDKELSIVSDSENTLMFIL